ncbi:hypothetical protein H310_01117 [Aphanomyces invadans]|uniref:Uncharacterized protein n=1 Tax=Aphanomyces invadans TaxID=157072 RepID=A0A024UQ43_9STRA|nr:hypothetical protein H310_01117 [Aphanomyces invadans]ETW08561.1 hypothetical protein H310_01117 [Aphanomyces invadans]|eukprot:XP_008862366.1 hypothetical protein H310_01117 [Aphanomyces invadans]
MFGLARVQPDRHAGVVVDGKTGLSSPLKPPTDAEVLTTTKYHELVPPAHVSEAMQHAQSSQFATTPAPTTLELPQDIVQAMKANKAAPNRYAMAVGHPRAMQRSTSRYVDTYYPQLHAN